MNNYKITCDNGAVCIIRASSKQTAKMLFCKAEGCTEKWFKDHCTIRKVKEIPYGN